MPRQRPRAVILFRPPDRIPQPATQRYGFSFAQTAVETISLCQPPPTLYLQVPLLEVPEQEWISLLTEVADQTITLQLAPPPVAEQFQRLPKPIIRRKVFQEFVRQPLEQRGKGQIQIPPPDDDPFSCLYYILLAKQPWDLRLKNSEEYLRAFPEGKQPFPYQLEGIRFLTENSRALLADEMGLGKTIQAILAFRALIHGARVRRVLIVCPKSLLATWHREIEEWAPELKKLVVHGSDKHQLIKQNANVYITNYESILTLKRHFHGPDAKQIDLLVVDEIQNLKNPVTRRAEAVTELPIERRWGLSGTPFENRMQDYNSVWNVIEPGSLASWKSHEERMHQTKSRVLRREKSEVLKDLPDKTIRTILVTLDDQQQRAYQTVKDEQCAIIVKQLKDGTSIKELQSHVLTVIMKLKQLCIYDPNSGQSAKMEWLEEFLEELHDSHARLEDSEKVLVFTQYPQLVWDEWQLPLKVERYNPLRYDGKVRDADKHQFVKRFQKDEKHRVAFIGIKSGGTGLTLTRANHVVFLDQWWNPAVMDQAAARIHRIGQHRNCMITKLIAQNTIDEEIDRLLDSKREQFQQLMEDIKAGRRPPEDLNDLSKAVSLTEMLQALGIKPADGAVQAI